MLSRAITLVESTRAEHRVLAAELIDAVLPFSGHSVRVGITGVPGVGKSTFIEAFGMELIEQGKKVAVLAIDPSSALSKGSILGDKTRMDQLSVHPDAFIRPTAAGGSLGGLSYTTREATLLCEAAGFDYIIIETVGVGQSETEVSRITDFFLLLMLAGAGDELQGIKRGIMELADGLIVTKADGDNLQQAKSARAEYARALHFLPPTASGWRPEVQIASAYERRGISEAVALIEKFVHHQQVKGFFQQNRDDQNLYAFQRLLRAALIEWMYQDMQVHARIKDLEQAVQSQQISPYSAVRSLMQSWTGPV
jgi:LAO/AO transport system kinase